MSRCNLARKISKTLTEGELRIMEVVWKQQNASVRDVATVLQEEGSVAYNTVQTMLRILEEKGYLKHTKSGRSFIYSPLVGRQKARSAALKQLLSSFFDDSPQSLVVNLLEHEELDATDIQKLKDLIAKSE